MGVKGNPWWIPLDNSDNSKHEIFQPSNLANPKKQGNKLGVPAILVLAFVISIVGGFLGNIFYNQISNVRLNSTNTVVERAPNSIAAIAAKVSPAVVSIKVTGSFGGDTGSGFFISSNGYILTNNHVIANAAAGNGNITVNTTSGTNYPAKLIGRDSSYDLAIIRISVSNASVLPLGDSDKVVVGDPVIAVGSPLDLAGTVTSGIISAKDRAVSSGDGNGVNSYIQALQTDAAINPGNSGGPLLDSGGNVIGINSAIATVDNSSFGNQSGSIGIGFAIPINKAKAIAQELIKQGYADHPILGIELDSSNPNQAFIANTEQGVQSNGPAAKAGLKPGDEIVAIDGKQLDSPDQLIVLIRSHNVGDKISLTINRGGRTFDVKVVLGSSHNQN